MVSLDRQFVGEARDLLEQIGDGFLSLERDPGNHETVRHLFRSVHTLKGASGIFEALAPLTRVLHDGEDVLDRVRDGHMSMTPELADTFLEVFDLVLEWVDIFDAQGQLPIDADAIAERSTAGLRAVLPRSGGDADSLRGPSTAANRPNWLDRLTPGAVPEDARVALTYRPDPQAFFQGDDPLRTVKTAPGLLWVAIVPIQPWPPLADLDPFIANLEFHVLSNASPEAMTAHFQYVENQIALLDLSVSSRPPARSSSDPGPGAADLSQGPLPSVQALADDVRAVMEELVESLQVPSRDPAITEGRIASTERILERLVDRAGLDAERLGTAAQDAVDADDPEPLVRFMSETLAVPLGSGDETPDPIGDGSPDAPANPADAPEAADKRPSGDGGRKSTAVKVDQERLDELMDMVGELVVVKNGLPFLAQAAEEEHGNKRLSRQIRAQYEALNRVTNALQASVMRMRMIPVGAVFNRFTRQVRDIARRLRKDIDLVLVGEDTEADKTVVEDLADPLVHLIRNACDHGLETASARRAAGKPERGRLTLAARPQDDHVLIELSDDGRGIDPDAIRRKALEKGLIDEERARALSDKEALHLILLPGFSTAETVSDLSGRGVGMDVVKTMVERRGGRLDIRSTVGVGTTVQLAVPLSMALTRVMLFDVGGQQFGIPMAAISETRRVRPEEIHRVKDHECIVRRERVITLRRLTRVLGLPDPEPPANAVVTDPAVLMLDVDGQETGLVVDRFHEGMDLVVKPMEGLLTTAPIYAGTALLGDGRVLPVFNAKELIRCL